MTSPHDALYGTSDSAPARYCAPRLNEGYEVEAVWQWLALRAGRLQTADAQQLGAAVRGYIDCLAAPVAAKPLGR